MSNILSSKDTTNHHSSAEHIEHPNDVSALDNIENIQSTLQTLVTDNSFLTMHYALYCYPIALNADVDVDAEIEAEELEAIEFDPDAQCLANTFEAATPITLQLGAGQFSPVLESLLLGLSANQTKAFTVTNAFGQFNPELLKQFAIADLHAYGLDASETFAAGDMVAFNLSDAQKAYALSTQAANMPETIGATFIAYSEDQSQAMFDFNHPLAGKKLYFKAQILGIL